MQPTSDQEAPFEALHPLLTMCFFSPVQGTNESTNEHFLLQNCQCSLALLLYNYKYATLHFSPGGRKTAMNQFFLNVQFQDAKKLILLVTVLSLG